MNNPTGPNLLFSELQTNVIVDLLVQDDPRRRCRIDRSWLSVRVCNVLYQERIETVGDLATYPDARLLGLRNFGARCLHQLKLALIDQSGDLRAAACAQANAVMSPAVARAGAMVIDPGDTVADEIMAIATAIMSLGKRADDATARRNVSVVRARYGLDGKAPTLAAIGNPLGISRARVQQLLGRLPGLADKLEYAPGTQSHRAKLRNALQLDAVDVLSRTDGDGLDGLLGPVLTLWNAARFYDDVFRRAGDLAKKLG